MDKALSSIDDDYKELLQKKYASQEERDYWRLSTPGLSEGRHFPCNLVLINPQRGSYAIYDLLRASLTNLRYIDIRCDVTQTSLPLTDKEKKLLEVCYDKRGCNDSGLDKILLKSIHLMRAHEWFSNVEDQQRNMITVFAEMRWLDNCNHKVSYVSRSIIPFTTGKNFTNYYQGRDFSMMSKPLDTKMLDWLEVHHDE